MREFQNQSIEVGRPTHDVRVSITIAQRDPESHAEEKKS